MTGPGSSQLVNIFISSNHLSGLQCKQPDVPSSCHIRLPGTEAHISDSGAQLLELPKLLDRKFPKDLNIYFEENLEQFNFGMEQFTYMIQ